MFNPVPQRVIQGVPNLRSGKIPAELKENPVGGQPAAVGLENVQYPVRQSWSSRPGWSEKRVAVTVEPPIVEPAVAFRQVWFDTRVERADTIPRLGSSLQLSNLRTPGFS
jgi:hypothetical protein